MKYSATVFSVVVLAALSSACVARGGRSVEVNELASVDIVPPSSEGLVPGKDYTTIEVWTADGAANDFAIKATFTNISGATALTDEKLLFKPGTYKIDLRLIGAGQTVVAAGSLTDARCLLEPIKLKSGKNADVRIKVCAGIKPVEASGDASVSIIPEIVPAQPVAPARAAGEAKHKLEVVSKTNNAGDINAEIKVSDLAGVDAECTVAFEVRAEKGLDVVSISYDNTIVKVARSGAVNVKVAHRQAQFPAGYVFKDLKATATCTGNDVVSMQVL